MAYSRHYLSVRKIKSFIKNMDTMNWILVGDGITKMIKYTFPVHSSSNWGLGG